MASQLPRKSFAEAARIVALQISKRNGDRLPVLDNLRTGNPTCRPSQILPRLYLGDFFHASDENELTRLRITHVLSILETPPSFKNGYGATLKKLHLPLRDSFAVNILKHLDETTSFIRDAMEDPVSVILVHCFQGISRSATVVAAYLLASSTGFFSANEALQFVRKKRSIVSPNYGFVRQLDEYAAICLERRNIPLKTARYFVAEARPETNGTDKDDGIVQVDTLQCSTIS